MASSLCSQAGGKGITPATLFQIRASHGGEVSAPRYQLSAWGSMWKWDPPTPFPCLGPGCTHQKVPSAGKGLGVGSAFPQLLVTQSKNRSYQQHWPAAACGAPLPAPSIPAPSKTSLQSSQRPLARAQQLQKAPLSPRAAPTNPTWSPPAGQL